MPMYRTVSPLSRTIVSPSTTLVTIARVQAIGAPLGIVGDAAAVAVASSVEVALGETTVDSAAGAVPPATADAPGGTC
ncbi:MAG TPA: hypothetical protein VM537_27850 [Anaerolineae bacterium]|nr:hypothetical protein [Anaerolineae bacterium]